MKNIAYEGYLGPHLPKEVQKKRLLHVLQEELTPLQREAVVGYYIEHKSIPQMAKERGVHKSTICRNHKRGENRLRRFLKY